MPTTVALLITAIVAAAPTGWLGDGTGHFEGSVPTGWSADAPGGWVTSLSDWSNASPVVVGEKVCVTIEPLSVVCLSTATGKQLWSHEVTYLDTVVAADRPRVAAEQAEAQRLAEALRSKERELNKLKRAMRKARGSGDARARSEALVAEIGPLKEQLDRFAYLRPPDPIDIMGTAPSTPLTDGSALYVLMGNGVAASLTLDGAVRWARHLGRPAQRMRGFHKGQAASPLLVNGVLVAPLNHLTGLDPATGKVLWTRAEPYLDFGPRARRSSTGFTSS